MNQTGKKTESMGPLGKLGTGVTEEKRSEKKTSCGKPILSKLIWFFPDAWDTETIHELSKKPPKTFTELRYYRKRARVQPVHPGPLRRWSVCGSVAARIEHHNTWTLNHWT